MNKAGVKEKKMDKKTISKLLTIAGVCLLLSAMIFICLCLFSAEKTTRI